MPTTTTLSRTTITTLTLLHLTLAILTYITLTQSQALHLPIPTAVFVFASLVPVLPVLAIVAPAAVSVFRGREKSVTDLLVDPVGGGGGEERERNGGEDGGRDGSDGERPHRLTPLARPVLAILALFDVALIAASLTTLDSSTLAPSIASTWSDLYSTHSSTALRTIEEALKCCGFESPADRAYPFPTPQSCVQTYGFTKPCAPRLREREQAGLGVFVGVGVFALAVKGVLGVFTTTAGVDGRRSVVGRAKGKGRGVVSGSGEGSWRGGGRYRDVEG